MSVAIRSRLAPSLPVTLEAPKSTSTVRAPATRAARPAATRSVAPPPTSAARTPLARFAAAVRGFFARVGSVLVTLLRAPINALLMVGGRALSAVQTLIGVEPAGRGLSSAETAELRKVFGDSVDYGRVRIKEGNAGLLTVFGHAFTHGETIYVLKRSLPLSRDALVHEMVHVWQYQRGGTSYMSEAIWAQWFGDAYDWRKGIEQGKSWPRLDPEQQAQLVSDAYATGIFDGGSVRPGGGDAYAGSIQAAITELRAGRGAP